jgi:hypothetical protein
MGAMGAGGPLREALIAIMVATAQTVLNRTAT